jgi:hypothetical protein
VRARCSAEWAAVGPAGAGVGCRGRTGCTRGPRGDLHQTLIPGTYANAIGRALAIPPTVRRAPPLPARRPRSAAGLSHRGRGTFPRPGWRFRGQRAVGERLEQVEVDVRRRPPRSASDRRSRRSAFSSDRPHRQVFQRRRPT